MMDLTPRSRRCPTSTALAIGLIGLLSLPLFSARGETAKLPPDQIEFFEKRVRPVLANTCFECHSDKKQKGGLRLDSRDALMHGGSSGPAIVPGNPVASRLVDAVVYHNSDLRMPPKKRLPDNQIEDLVQWVKLGAPWPGSENAGGAAKPAGGPTSPETIAAMQKSHWSLKPVVKPAVPKVKNAGWVKTPVDNFILARLEERGFSPAPAADKAALIRRVYMDLIGLPPTFDEVQAFVNDRSPEAYARLIDKLLAMPQYGERWGRHWLDIARYSDTRGYQVGGAEIRFPFSYTYRDYVIDAFNDDKPYDRFIIEQLAADKLKLGEDQRPLAAMGFITVGRQFLQTNDTIDDRIDVIVRGLMGMTIACARCHDHKFDPIPTADYYALYGIIASSEEPKELPLIEQPGKTAGYLEFKKELDKREGDLAAWEQKTADTIAHEARSRAADYLLVAAERLPGSRLKKRDALRTERGEMRPLLVQQWVDYLNGVNVANPVFAPWKLLRGLDGNDFAAKAKAEIAKLDEFEKAKGHVPINAKVKAALKANPPKSMGDLATLYGKLLEDVYAQWQEQCKKQGGDPANVRLSDPADEQLRMVLFADSSPAFITIDEARAMLNRAEGTQQRNLRSKIEQWKINSPATPARAMVMVDKPKPMQPYVFMRGQQGNRGPNVDRRNLSVLAPVDGGKKYVDGSGRLELAQAIASPNNPLTARVMVNRIWLHHFGEGICRTPADFGVRSDPPTHPELLDYLAAAFVESGWSVKQMHRLIMLSATYQQSADMRTDIEQQDSENRLFHKQNRRRLEFEPMRDSMLMVAGRIDRSIGGKPVDIAKDQMSTRRSIYAFINRQDMPGLLINFDYPTPDVSTADRPRTTVPQQALFLMNSQFIAEQARGVIRRANVEAEGTVAQKLERVFKLVFSRLPTPAETQAAQAYLAAEQDAKDKGKVPAWHKLAQAMLMSNEFIFVD
jgi:hypothetical protein